MTATYQPNMEIIRLPKNSEHPFTVISNDKLSFAYDKRMSPTAYGILCKALALIGMNEVEEDDDKKGWHFTVAGFCEIMNAGETRIRSGLKELEQLGYFVMEKTRDELGRFRKAVYRFSETIQEAWRQNSEQEEHEPEKNPDSENGLNPSSCPHCDFPDVDNPHGENQAQSKTHPLNTNSEKKANSSQSVSPVPETNNNVENYVENSVPERLTDGLPEAKNFTFDSGTEQKEISTILKKNLMNYGNEAYVHEVIRHLETAVSEGTISLNDVTSKLITISETEHSLNAFMDKLRCVCAGASQKNLRFPEARDRYIRKAIVNTLMEYVPKSDKVPAVRTESALPEYSAPVSEPAVKKSEDEKKKKVLTFREMLFYMRSPLLENCPWGMNSEIFDSAENFGSYYGWDAEDVEAKYCVIPEFFANNRKNMENALKFLMGWNALEDGEFKSFSSRTISYLAEVLETGKISGKSAEIINVQSLISYLNYINWGGKDEYDREHSDESMYDFMHCFFEHYCQQIEAYPPYSSNLKGYLTKMLVNYLDGEYQAHSTHAYAAMDNLMHSFQHGCKKF